MSSLKLLAKNAGKSLYDLRDSILSSLDLRGFNPASSILIESIADL